MNHTMRDIATHALRYAADYLQDRRRTRRAVRELAALGERDAERLVADAGFGREEFADAMARPFASQDLLSPAAEALGIDRDGFAARDAARMRALERTCALCRSRGHCKWVLETGDFRESYRGFCANAGEFDAILASRRIA